VVRHARVVERTLMGMSIRIRPVRFPDIPCSRSPFCKVIWRKHL